jgi:cell division septation protein DedD
MTTSEYGQQGVKDDADAILVDHSLAANNSRTNLWPIAIGSVATILVLAGVATALFQRESMEQEITRLSQELLSSRKNVERLITENALLERKLQALIDSTQSDSPVIHSESSVVIASADPSGIDTIKATADQSKEPAGEMISATAEPAKEAVVETDTATGLSDVMGQSASLPDTAESAAESQGVFAPLAKTPNATSAGSGKELGAWAVVVGAFSTESNHDNLVSALESEGYEVVTQTITRGGRELQQVKVIGFSTKSDGTAAAAAIERTYRTGRLRVVSDSIDTGKSRQQESVPGAPLSSSSGEVASSSKGRGESASSGISSNTSNKGVSGNTESSAARWFIYIDTFTDSNEANDLAKDLGNKGYNAKVAVEYRAGNLYYRVQVVGIDSRQAGEDIVSNLVESGDLPNIQLRTY